MADAPREVWHGITRLVRGGAQLVVLDLVRGLDRSRFRPVLLAGEETGSEGSLWPEAEKLGVELIRVPNLVRAASPWKDLRALGALTRLLRERRPAIVHAHTSKAGFILCRAARRARIPGVILSPHGHILGAAAEIPGVPSVGWKRRVFARLARSSARSADIVVCPNAAERADGIAHGMWSDENSVVVPNGVDTERFCPGDRATVRGALGWAHDVPTIGVVARLTREKGVDLAIRAVAALPGVRLVLVGDGPERDALRALVEELSVSDRVEFLGLRDDVPALYPGFDLILVPSRTEAHGLVAAEALSCEVPVVAAKVGGLREIVDVECGRLVPAGEPEEFAVAIGELLDDRAHRVRLGERGREIICERWSREAMLRATEEVYEQLLARTLTTTR